MTDQLKNLEEVLEIQCRDGNWNYNEYSLGLANGLILAYALLKGEIPIYLEAPSEWLTDKPKEQQ